MKQEEIRLSTYWKNQGKTYLDIKEGKTFEVMGEKMCAECCNKDRCSGEECDAYYRPNCPHCLGSARNKSCFKE